MFKTTETKDVKSIIFECYKLDKPLIEKWLNVSGSGIDACVQNQVDALTSQPTFKMFKVEVNGQLVGYFGNEHDGAWMATIFIVPEYRPRKKEFWLEVESKMQKYFKCAGYHKNEPACKFYAKFGKPVGPIETRDGPGTMFEFNRN